MSKQNQHKPNVPELRFPEFIGEWEEFRLKDIALINDGTHTTPKYVEKGIPFFSVENVSRNDFVNCKYVTEEAYNRYNKRIKIEKDDILMTRIGSIGAVKLVDWSYKSTFYVSLALLKVFKNFISQFIVYLIESPSTQKNILRNSLVTAVPQKINLVDLKEVKVKLPINKKEQQKLGNFFSKLDRQIELEEKKLALLEEQKKGYMQKIFSQELRFKDENGNEYPEWEEKRLGEIGVFLKSYAYSRNIEGLGRIKYIHYGDIHSKISSILKNTEKLPTITKNQEHQYVEKGDIVFADASEDYKDLGKTILVDFSDESVISGLHTHLYRPSKKNSSLFLLYLTKTSKYKKFIKKEGNGVSVLGISKNSLKRFRASMPVLDEQIKIGVFFETIDNKILSIEAKINKLRNMKKGMLQNMFI